MTDDAYTMEMRLCDDDGMVTGEYRETHARLRRLGGHEPYDGPDYMCTGHAHLAGEHIRCTSEAHSKPLRTPTFVNHRLDGIALVAVANDVRSLFKGDPDVPVEFFADLDTVERVGRTLYFQTPITLPVTITVAGGTCHSPSGPGGRVPPNG